MKYTELIDRCIQEKRKVFVNGMPDEEGGIITKRDEDFIAFEITKIAEKQENTTKETIYTPINNILSISSGEKKVSTLNSKPSA